MAVRKQCDGNPQKSIKMWMELRSQMERERIEVAEDIRKLTDKLLELKPRVKAEMAAVTAEEQPERMSPNTKLVIDLLIEIRDLLKQGSNPDGH